ncbi:MAG: hypothetical protein WAX68_00495 [Streptococcus suis]
MTFQTFSDTPNIFKFNYTFKDFDTAQVAGHALIGYMIGTFDQPVIDVSYRNDERGGYANQLTVEYVVDDELVEVFNRICDGFKDYDIILDEDLSDEDIDDIVIKNELMKEIEEAGELDYELVTGFEQEYVRKRTEQLKQSESFDSLIKRAVAYELELIDYAERLLSDDPIPMDSEMAYMTLDLIGGKGVRLLKSLDEDDEYGGLAYYKANEE